MLQQTNMELEEKLNGQTSIKKTHKEECLIERKEIEGTPFTMIRQEIVENKPEWFIVMGNHRLTEPTTSEETQLEKLVNDYWKIVVNVIAIVIEKYNQTKTQEYEMAKKELAASMAMD